MNLFILKTRLVDPNKLFEIFQVGNDEAVYKKHGLERAMDSPYVLMGMVIRGVENYHLMDVMYSRNYPKEYKRNKKSITRRYFSKLYSYLPRITQDPYEVIQEMENGFDFTQIVIALDYLRDFFEKIEHYEKCAVIKIYLDAAVTFKTETT